MIVLEVDVPRFTLTPEAEVRPSLNLMDEGLVTSVVPIVFQKDPEKPLLAVW